MKKLWKCNQSGLTLVELLAVLVLISLVTGVIWSTMSISIKHNTIETTKLQLQQEANLIITKLQNTHRYNDCYLLTMQSDRIEVNSCSGEEKPLHEVLSNGYSYDFLIEISSLNEPSKIISEPSEIIDIRVESNENDLDIKKFYVTEVDKSGQKVKNGLRVNVPTMITRIKNTTAKGEEDETN